MPTSDSPFATSTRAAAPLVSVVVPARNAEATLARALRSAVAQDYPNLEVLVVDDGSTDRTRAVVEEFAVRVAAGEFAESAVAEAFGTRAAGGEAAECAVSEPTSARAATEPSGPAAPGLAQPRRGAAAVRCLARSHAGAAAARNAGIAEAQGEFVAFLDADDEWLPGYLSRTLEPMLRDGAVGMTWCRALRRTPDGGETIFGQAFDRAKPFRDRLWPPAEQCTPATICRAEVLRRAGNPEVSKVAQAFQPVHPTQAFQPVHPTQAIQPARERQAGKPAPQYRSARSETFAGPFDESLATREDQDLWIRMREQAGVVAVPNALVVVHARERASESRRDWARIRADYFAVLEHALARRTDLYGPHLREIRAEAAWHWGLMALKAGDCTAARRALWRSLLTAPRLRTVPPALASLLPSALLSRLLQLRSSG